MTMPSAAFRPQQPIQPIQGLALRPMRAPAAPAARRPATVSAPVPAVGDDLFALGAETQTLVRDEALFYEGDDADIVYRIVEGMVRISILLADGRRHIVDFLHPGDIIGLAPGDTHAHTAEAVTPVTLSRMPRARLDTAMKQRPAVARKLFAAMQADLVAAHDRLLLLGRKSVMERLASFLLILRSRQPVSGMAGTVRLPMGRTDIADYLGLTIETVSRTITKMRTAGLIQLVDTYQVIILDPERLARLAAGTTE